MPSIVFNTILKVKFKFYFLFVNCMKYLLLIFTIGFLTACVSPRHYVKHDFNAEDWQQDKAQCNYQAHSATVGIYSALEAAFAKRDLIDLCLKSKGYALQE